MTSTYVWQVLGRILPQGLAFGSSIAVVRFAGLDAMGMYGICIVVTSAGFGVFSGAFDTHFLRIHQSTSFLDVVVAKIALWTTFCVPSLLVLWAMDISLWPGFAIYAGLLFLHLGETVATQARIAGNDRASFLPRVLPPAALLLLLIWLRPSTFDHMAVLFLGSWLLVLTVLRVPKHSVHRTLRARVRDMTLGSRSLVAMLFLTQVYGSVGLILVKAFHDYTVAGELRIAQAFASVLMPAIGVFSFVYLSQLRQLISDNKLDRISGLLRRQIAIHAGMGLLVLAALALSLPVAIPWMYGQEARAAIAPTLVLCGSASLNAVGMVFIYTQIGLNRDRDALLTTASAAFASVMLSSLLVPEFGAIGAAWAMVATFTLMLLVCVPITVRALKKVNDIRLAA